jgi:hypothetical protein
MYRRKVVIVTLTIGKMILLFTCMNFWVEEFYEGGPPTANEVVRDCRKFEKH